MSLVGGSSSVVDDGGGVPSSPPSCVSPLGGDGVPPAPAPSPSPSGCGDMTSPLSLGGGRCGDGGVCDNNAPGGCPSCPVSGGSKTPPPSGGCSLI